MSQNNENGVIIRDLSPFQAALIRENVVIARQKRDKTRRVGEFMRIVAELKIQYGVVALYCIFISTTIQTQKGTDWIIRPHTFSGSLKTFTRMFCTQCLCLHKT